MNLRKHQRETAELCREILSGAPIREIIESVTPGGGKSSLPVILAENLIPVIADRICWIVPRDSLKFQGEGEFLEPRWGTSKRIRAADNGNDLSRGTCGYVTTYQAVGAKPSCHAEEFKRHRYILFLDEPHHLAKGSEWERAVAPLVESAVLIIYASGTLSRGDGEKIAFLPYKSGEIDLEETETRRVITYSRSDAIRDGSILRVGFNLLDGESEWEELDGTKGVSKLSGEESAKALFTALRTDFSKHLIDATLLDFHKELLVYPDAKMLVVAPNIVVAQEYANYLFGLGKDIQIATSDDGALAKKRIDDFKRGVYKILVTVAMAYEGLNVPEITHICSLTHIRSVPWLEQMIARANRLAPGKTRAVVFAPADHQFKKARKMIDAEQLVPLSNPDEQMELAPSQENRGEGSGEVRPWIIPVGSTVLDGTTPRISPAETLVMPPCSHSEAEKILRKNIHQHISAFLEDVPNGSKLAYQKILYRRMRIQVHKPIAEMSVKELEKIWVWLRAEYPLKDRGAK